MAFYTNLYTSKSSDCLESSSFSQVNIISLTKEEQTICEGVLTQKECFETLKNMDSDKTPGTDGLATCQILQSFLERHLSFFMWTFTRSVKIHILRSCSFPDWDGTFRDNSSQPFRKLSRVFGESEVLEPRVNVKLARRHKESITQFH